MTKIPTAAGTSADLLSLTNERWDAFVAYTDALTPEQWTTPTDPAGWSVKDHVAHVTSWGEADMEVIRNGTPQQQTLGVSDAAWTAGGYDAMNEEIRQRTIDHPVETVQAERDRVWSEMLALVSSFSDEQLAGPATDAGINRVDATLYETLVEFLPEHYDEHRGYIEVIVTGGTA